MTSGKSKIGSPKIGRQKLYWISASLAVLTASAAYAAYEKQVEWLQNLRAPLRPTRDQCTAIAASFSDASRKFNEAHEKCLNSGGNQQSGKTCSKASCQGLHDLRDYAQQRAAAEAKLCSERARLVEAEEREQKQRDEAFKREQEALARAQAEQYERQMREAQYGSIKAAPASRPPAPSSGPNISAGDVSEVAESVAIHGEMVEGAGLAEEVTGRAIKADKSLPGPVRNSIGDKTINAAKGKVKLGSAVGTGATIVDTGAKLADGDYSGAADNAIGLVIDKVASAWCAQAGPAAAGCELVYMGGKLAGEGINAGTKALTGTTMRDHITDLYYKQIYEPDPDWQYRYMEERTGTPAETWKAEAEAREAEALAKKQVSPKPTPSNGSNPNLACSALSNESNRQSLAQSNLESYLQLWNSCKK